MCCVIAGEAALTAMGVPVLAFQIAGGIVPFLFALVMIFGESQPESEANDESAAADRDTTSPQCILCAKRKMVP